jgi:hypothetical protein
MPVMSTIIVNRYYTIAVVLWGCLSSACKSTNVNTVDGSMFKMGFKSSSFSTGPRNNSGFLFKLDPRSPTLFLTAHHCAANTGEDDHYYKWDEIQKHVKNGWIWSMSNPRRDFSLGRNLPLLNAETMKLDVAAFYLNTKETPYLLPAKKAAIVGDTVKLLSQIVYKGDTTLQKAGVVTYVSDSVLIYELLIDERLNFSSARFMKGTSGSAVLNRENDVISNSVGAVIYLNDETKAIVAQQFPLIEKFHTSPGKIYGIGVPIHLIVGSIAQALKNESN